MGSTNLQILEALWFGGHNDQRVYIARRQFGVQFKEKVFSAFKDYQNEMTFLSGSEFPFSGVVSTGWLALGTNIEGIHMLDRG